MLSFEMTKLYVVLPDGETIYCLTRLRNQLLAYEMTKLSAVLSDEEIIVITIIIIIGFILP